MEEYGFLIVVIIFLYMAVIDIFLGVVFCHARTCGPVFVNLLGKNPSLAKVFIIKFFVASCIVLFFFNYVSMVVFAFVYALHNFLTIRFIAKKYS